MINNLHPSESFGKVVILSNFRAVTMSVWRLRLHETLPKYGNVSRWVLATSHLDQTNVSLVRFMMGEGMTVAHDKKMERRGRDGALQGTYRLV